MNPQTLPAFRLAGKNRSFYVRLKNSALALLSFLITLAALSNGELRAQTFPSVTSGTLVLRLESDNVTTSGSNVTAWPDQSGQANDLTAVDAPQLVSGLTPNGQPAIAFDGTDDRLQRIHATDPLNGFPDGDDDRTMFVVVRYESDGWGGTAYGNDNGGQAFGLVLNGNGDLTVQRWASDYQTSINGNGIGWLVQSAVLSTDGSDKVLRHYQDGGLIDDIDPVPSTRPFNTNLVRMVVGAEIDNAPHLDMDVAAILLYDGALNATDRDAVESYLQNKYLRCLTNFAVTTPACNGIDAEFDISFDVTNSSGNYTVFDEFDNVIDNFSDVSTGSVTRTITVTSPTSSSSMSVRVEDTNDANCTSQTLSVSIPHCNAIDCNVTASGSLVLWLESDAGVTVTSGDVTQWADQSGSGNTLFGSGDPKLMLGTSPGSPNGENYIEFDGSGDKLERLNANDAISGLSTGSDDRTIAFVVRYNTTGVFGGLSHGDGSPNQAFGLTTNGSSGLLTIQGWGGGNDKISGEPGTGQGWLVQSAVLGDDEYFHYRDGAQIGNGKHTYNTANDKLVIAEEINNLGFVEIDVAAALIFDRALNGPELQNLHDFLRSKYLGAGVCTVTAQAFPAELVHFSARYENEAVNLHWITQVEVNFAGFSVERSLDGRSFETVAWVDAAGGDHEQHYRLQDEDLPPSNLFYYRLRQVDIDGSYEYSKVVAIARDQWDETGITVFPNPSSGLVTVSLPEGLRYERGEARLWDQTGRLLQRSFFSPGDVGDLLTLDWRATPAGIYLLEMAVGTEVIRRKLVIR